MKNILSNISVTNRLLTISIVFVLTVVIIAINVVSTLEMNAQDGTVINVAGRQRMLTKKFASEVMLSLQRENKVTAPQLSYDNTIKLYEISLQALKTGGQTFSDLSMQTPIDLVKSTATEFNNKLYTVEQLWFAQKAMALELLQSSRLPSEEKIDAFMLANHKTLAAMNQAVLSYNKHSDNNISALKKDITLISLVSLSLTIILLYLIGRSLIEPINKLVTITREISKGDLEDKSHSAELTNRSELGLLATNIFSMRHALSSVVKGLKTSADSISRLSNRVESLAQEVDSSYDDEKRKYDEIAKISDELFASFERASQVVENTLESAAESQKSAQLGLETIHNNIKAVELASAESEKVSQNIQELSQVAEKVYSIIDVIQIIAEQTNLLALNAAIEAARAGEQGRGFAVVSDEVRVLASKTNHSTGEISNLLNELTERVKVSVDSVAQLQKEVENSKQCSSYTAQNIERISNSISLTVGQQHEIAALIDEQSRRIHELREAQSYLSNLLKNTNKKIKDSSFIAVDMNDMAKGISSTLDDFSLSASK
ncbi:methyl-accepting chemotaxis protein [Vibrio zhanjiangensis]|uniref:Methyl-accepting chemotaxis protein n=1 Tax=Vibrio zhanjiangensis TaxID=1046128 RepID=A0ABQ6EV55_9VIBR|nr:methyl-accepting chemotaxis protein [Vibrio zhanjiangensis]GLT16869.1 methyl-accepting chemotaxis protein [Vibrio zhanjiangensis]